MVVPADPEAMPLGGIASFIRGFTRFAPPGLEVAFVGVSRTRPAWSWHTVQLEGRPVRFLPVARGGGARRSRLPISLRFTLALLARRRQWRPLLPDGSSVLMFHRPATDLAFRGWTGVRWRVVHLSIDDLRMRGSESRWRRLGNLLDRVERRSLAAMDRVVVVNRAVADEYRHRLPEVASRIEFVPNWADPTVFHARDVRRQPAEGAPCVLYAGRLEGQKDPLLLVDAFLHARERVDGLRLVVAGDGTLRGRMKDRLRRADASDAVTFLGIVERERLAELMRDSTMLAITSIFETGPTVGLEALACGLPVVTTPVGEVAGIVASSGAGAVSPDRSAESVAAGIAAVAGRGPDLRTVAVAAAEPYLAPNVLGPLYERLARATDGGVAR